MLKSRDEYRDDCRDENRFECGFEFKCVFESRFEGPFEYGCEYGLECVYNAERDCCVMALGDQSRADKRDCERMRVQICLSSVPRNKAIASADSASSTTPLTRTTQLRCGEPRTVVTVAAKVKQVELWRLEKCDWRIKAWEAREIQLEVRVGAKRECLSKLVVRLKHDRIDDDAEDERNEKGLRDCFFPKYYANPGVSPLRRRTERQVRRDSCDKVHIVFTEGAAVHVLCVHSRRLDDG